MDSSHRRKKEPSAKATKSRPPTISSERAGGTQQHSPEPSSVYKCGRCGHREELASDDFLDPHHSFWATKKPKAEWWRCPNDGGPIDGYLVDVDAQSMRIRYELGHRPRVCVCTPGWPIRFAGKLQVMPLLSLSQLHCEAYLEDYLDGYGPDERINLGHVTGMGTFNPHWQINRRDKRWQMDPSLQRTTLDEWRRKIDILRERWHFSQRRIPFEIARILGPRLGSDADTSDQVVYVGVDLRFALEGQLKEAQQHLQEIRRYLYQFTQKPPSRDRRTTLWRDIYILLLSEIEGNSVSEIGEEVFPRHTRKSREHNVRQIIRKLKKILKAAGRTSLLDG